MTAPSRNFYRKQIALEAALAKLARAGRRTTIAWVLAELGHPEGLEIKSGH
jgi:hypothetical protein